MSKDGGPLMQAAKQPDRCSMNLTSQLPSKGCHSLSSFIQDELGATAIEYGLIGALISIVAIAAMTAIGTSLKATFTTVTNAFAGGN